MELLLTQDISLEMINQCLHLACKLGNVSIIRSLLQHNADPGSRNDHNNTVLHVAVASNSGEAVNALIKGHAVIKYINGQNNSGDTVLHIACRHTNTDIMETLLQAGADANIRNYSDEAAIHLTCKQKDSNPVEILLDKGCDANSLSKGLSPLHIACEYSNLAVVRVLVKHKANVNAEANLTTPLHVAERQKKGDIVCYLIENGANKFAKDVDQHTPLAYRYYVNGHVHITPHVEMLLNKRSDVNCALPDDNTALIHEVKENHLDVVKELIRRGAIIDKHDKEGRSPLLIACYFGFADIVKYLVDRGASIDSPDVEGRTPLYIACDYGHADIAKFLISKGANPNLASEHEKKKTPSDIIKRSGNVEIKRLYKVIKLPKVQD
ncbi:ankyrin-1-like [Haliotis rufescens]|uniref:ankyrin-1-like n=1 Tax=Haliotis rufescens TaxID=6454 RepID=UPI00201F0421|nr:ankyrin-1-like [Haliotis rufescens]